MIKCIVQMIIYVITHLKLVFRSYLMTLFLWSCYVTCNCNFICNLVCWIMSIINMFMYTCAENKLKTPTMERLLTCFAQEQVETRKEKFMHALGECIKFSFSVFICSSAKQPMSLSIVGGLSLFSADVYINIQILNMINRWDHVKL